VRGEIYVVRDPAGRVQLFGFLAAVVQNNSSKENFLNILCFYVPSEFKYRELSGYFVFIHVF
jgi:hypothetical protein